MDDPCRKYEELSDTEKEFIQLGWWLLEQKALYYLGEGNPSPIHPSWKKHHGVHDHEYDTKERRYDALAIRLGKDPTVTDMVGFDQSRPCCQLVLKKLGKPYPQSLLKRKVADLFG